MAGKSLGTLTIDLIAKVGGFVQGMDKAERASQKWSAQVKKDAKEVGASIVAIGAAAATAAVGIGAAGLAVVKNTAQQVTEADRWAKSLKMSTQDLLAWQYAAEQAGLTGDNIADIFKDINDKVGDAVLNKSGEAAQALDTLGLSAEKLSQQPELLTEMPACGLHLKRNCPFLSLVPGRGSFRLVLMQRHLFAT